MVDQPRMTFATKLVLVTMMERAAEMYGLQICRATGLASGTVKPILDRFERYEWATVRTEDGSPQKLGRPLRRYYQLTETGIAEAQNVKEDRWIRSPLGRSLDS